MDLSIKSTWLAG
jgi:hypothetical protein